MLIGQKIGPFAIERELGSGAMGTVYKATFHKDGKTIPVALKVVSLGLLSNDGAIARFERESAILKQLRHPNIVRLFATGRYKQTPFIAMEFVDGDSLDKILELRVKLHWVDVVNYAKQLCEALQHAHEKGIIHRDLKPSNLMITRDGKLKLTDFGIAKDTDVTALTGANSTIGTAAYMSPEQCKGDRNLSHKSDLYSLGVVLYELLTGKKPFKAETTVELFLKHVNEVPVRPSRLVPDLPIWLDNLVMFLLEKDKETRPADAGTVAKLLAEIEEKVNSQQSVGQEVANARQVDRRIVDSTMNDADREAARSLRSPGKKKKKKKAVPFYAKKWVKGLFFGGLLLTILVGGGYTLWQQFKPLGIDAQYALIEKADSPEAKLKYSEEFLSAHGKSSDPRVEKVRVIFKEQKARSAEEIVHRRYGSKLGKGNSEGFDEDAYKLAINALDAEKAGTLARAAEFWTAVRDKSPQADPVKFPQENEVSKAVLGWVAEKKLRDINQTLPEQLRKVRKDIEDDRVHEVARTFPAGSVDGLVVKAIMLEAFGDKPKARSMWESVVTQSDKELEFRIWYLAATQHINQFGVETAKDDEIRAARLKRLEARIEQLETDWKKVESDPEARVPRREIRNGCRELILLYDDEPSETIKLIIITRAKKLMDLIPKSN